MTGNGLLSHELMAAAITPLNREWFYATTIQPFKEGAERINLAFNGVDALSLELRSLSLKERIIRLITGILLMIPLVNTIVWLAMQTFGQPDYLSDSYLPDEAP